MKREKIVIRDVPWRVAYEIPPGYDSPRLTLPSLPYWQFSRVAMLSCCNALVASASL